LPLPMLLALSLAPSFADDTAAVDPAHTWDLSGVYPSVQDWEAATVKAQADIDGLADCRGAMKAVATMTSCLERIDGLALDLSRIHVYASNLSSVDTRDAEWRARAQTSELLWASFGEATSWLQPELIAVGEKKIEKAIAKEPRLAPYDYYLRSVLRHGAHTLPPEQEALLAAAAPLMAAPGNIRGVLLDAELPWPTVTLADGTEVTLDGSGYTHYRASPLRADRETVFQAYFATLADFQGTAGAALGAAAQGHWFDAKVRGYDSSIEAALDDEFLPPAVYDGLIAGTNAHLPTLHRYLKLRARILGVDDLAYSDLYVPLVEGGREFPIEEGQALAIASAAPLGDVYTGILKDGFQHRWMDTYPATGKDPGAYMDGAAYEVHPFVLMNYTGDYLSVSTLAHEWGHAAHSALTNESQPHAKADYATFIAEIASTFAEALLLDHMLKEAKTDEERLLYLGAALEGLRTTFFRQAMFGEFEKALHEKVERDEPVTGEGLSEDYLKLVRRYYGHDQGVTRVDDAYAVEWVYIPHFYYDFYVWQYATSIAASSLLAQDVLDGKEGAVERYLDLLRAGGSDDPYKLLVTAGVDLAQPAPYDAIALRMEKIMDEIEAILDRQAPAAP